MAKKKKKMPGLNTSSTADISFMLLVFFLVTSSMDTDKGLVRRLPPPPENEQKNEVQINERNIMQVDIASSGKVRVCGGELYIETDFSTEQNIEESYTALAELRSVAKKFIAGEPHLGSDAAPEFSLENVDNGQQIGVVPCFDKHVISLQSDRGTPYASYFAVQNELVAAYNELRDERSIKEYGIPFNKLDDERKEVIRKIYPQKISEAEPKDYSKLAQ